MACYSCQDGLAAQCSSQAQCFIERAAERLRVVGRTDPGT